MNDIQERLAALERTVGFKVNSNPEQDIDVKKLAPSVPTAVLGSGETTMAMKLIGAKGRDSQKKPRPAPLGVTGPENALVVQTRNDPPFVTQVDSIINALQTIATSIADASSASIIDKTADYTVLTTENGSYYHNSGAVGAIIFSLPHAVVGLHYFFCVVANNYIKVKADGGYADIIVDGPAVTSIGGGYIRSTEIGAAVEVICLVDGQWNVFDKRGTWSVDE